MRARGQALALVLALAALAPAQDGESDGVPRDPLVYHLFGTGTDKKGQHVAVVGDADGDSAPDFAASARGPSNEDFFAEGRVDLHSGRDGKLIRSWRGNWDAFGHSGLWAWPDIDGDGVLELAGANYLGHIRVFSPRTGEPWFRLEGRSPAESFGFSVTRIPDVDGDGVGEVGAGNSIATLLPGLDEHGKVQCRSGRTGKVLWTRWGTTYQGFLGEPLIAAGDHDGDGAEDILAREVEVVQGPGGKPERRSVLRVLSGRSGALLRSYRAPPLPRLIGFGIRMASLGDRDGDGFPEVAVAAPHYRDLLPPEVGPARELLDGEGHDRGWVGVFRLPEFELLFAQVGRDPGVYPAYGDRFGETLSAGGDVDSDGAIDLLAGTVRINGSSEWPIWYGRLYAVSGDDGRTLAVHEFEQSESIIHIRDLSHLGDTDGDGAAEYMVLNYELNVNQGCVSVLTFHPEAPRFIRGDATGDGRVTIADAVRILEHSEVYDCGSLDPLPAGLPECPAALDVDASGCVSQSDAIWLIRHLFLPFHWAPAPPFPDCGQFYRVRVPGDVTTRHLECRGYRGCAGD